MVAKGVLCQIISALCAALGAMTMGTILGWSSPSQSILPDAVSFPVTQDDVASYGSVFGIGAVIGSMPAGTISNLVGRRYSMILYEIFVIVGWIILTIPNAVRMLLVGRILQGIGIGALCTIMPTYIGEITEPHLRGTLSATFQVLVCFGILYSFTLGSMTTYIQFNALCGMWAIFHVLGALIIPESPYYLLSKNKDDKAKESMTKLRDGNDVAISKELSDIKAEIVGQSAQQNTFMQVLSDKVNRKSLFIGIGCMFFQQTSGINMIIFHMNYIFKITNSSISPETSSISVGVVQVFMTLIAMVAMDKLGRRALLLLSALFMSMSCAGLGIYFMMQDSKLFASLDWLPLSLVVLYISAFAVGFGPVPWVVMGEIFSNEVKPYGTSIATATNWSLVFVVTFLSNEMTKLIGFNGVFIMYSLFCIVAIVFVWICVPETKNKSFAEIQAELAGSTSVVP